MSELAVTSDSFEKHISPDELETLFSELQKLRSAVHGFNWNGTPNIDYHFFLSGHSKEQDFVGLAEAVADADVVIPEVPGWSNRSLVAMRNIANGKKRALRPNPVDRTLTPEQVKQIHGDAETIQNILFNTHKRIEFIDLPKEQAAELHRQMFRALTFRFEEFDNLDEMVDHFVYAKSLEARFQLTRELHMMQSLDKLFSKQTESLKVLIALGADHTFITHQLINRGEKVKRTFYPKPLIYPYRDELTRRLIFGKSFDSNLVMKAIAEGALAFKNASRETNTVETGLNIRAAMDQYSMDQIAGFLGGALMGNQKRL